MLGSIESIELIQRLHSQRQFEGTGIRLFMVRRIIQRHGGNGWVYSRPQKSTTLYFSLPALVEAGGASC
jgi:light-regulated signal transduction histidine kinase (bacteriophytochrome)